MSKAAAPGPIPKMLLEMALDAVPTQLETLRKSRAPLEAFVWGFFDGRIAPGRNLAMAQAVRSGMTRELAARRIEGVIKDARARGLIFALGVLATVDEFPALLRGLGGDAAGVGTIAAWLAEPVAPGWFRLAVVAGSSTQTQLVRVDSLGRRK